MMDDFGKKHLESWLVAEFREEERDEVRALITNLWNTDGDYFMKHGHSYWELLDIAKRNRSIALETYKKRVEEAGGVYVGVMEGVDCELVLFNSKKTGDTLALKATELSIARVIAKIHDSNVAHAKGVKL